MSGRPEILYPLFSDLTGLPGVGPKTEQLLDQMGIAHPAHLLMTLPHAVTDRRLRGSVTEIPEGATGSVEVTIGEHQPPRRKGLPYRITVEDADTAFQLVFFHGRPDWLARQLPEGERRIVSGKIELYDGLRQMPHPDHILLPENARELPSFEPIYPLTAGLTLKLMTKAVSGALDRAPELPDWIDPVLKTRENWPSWRDALEAAHAPTSTADVSDTAPFRTRLAYDELFSHQLTLALARAARRKRPGRETLATGALSSRVKAALPYTPTQAQDRAVLEILADMARPHRMSRLLQGDVGSGKTLVALLAAVAAIEAGGQAVMMAPTEILARQHLAGVQPLGEAAGIVVELLTGRDKGAERKAKLAALARGDIQLLVGTHAVFQKDVVFEDLRLAIVDEQHRFGVAQRMELGAKGQAVDVLVMTATPIPRSLSLAQYGDMEVSVLDEKPPGRTPVSTALVSGTRIGEVIDHLRSALKEGRQAYWVCPLVEESEAVDLTAAEDRFRHLRAALGDDVVGLVHGQLPPAEKDAAMARFASGDLRVLVATTVIEVGVDVPNASIMVIERAESFGLAQLHQLRGRVGRGSAASTCLLMFQAPLSEGGRRRLEILRETEDGFRIAEEDLAMRGAGDLLGTVQSGLPRFRVADLERQSGLMATALTDARALLAEDPTLESDRGRAARTLLWLMERDQAIRLISVG
jgi:ATP-dependent DNA helicase RecG